LYNVILANSGAFIDALRQYRTGRNDAFRHISPSLEVLPESLSEFLKSDQAEPLTLYDSLDVYLSSLKSTQRAGSWEPEAYALVAGLLERIEKDETPDDVARTAVAAVERLKQIGIGQYFDKPIPRRFETVRETLELASRLTESDEAHTRRCIVDAYGRTRRSPTCAWQC